MARWGAVAFLTTTLAAPGPVVPPAGDCESKHNILCSATDIDSKGGVHSHTKCCQLCKEKGGCKAWSWDFVAGQCHLHAACPGIPNPKYHSGTLGGPSPPTPPGPTPRPRPGPPSPAGPCRDAACCKRLSRGGMDGKLCDDFYNHQAGIGVSMISMGVWTGKGKSGRTGVDSAKFYPQPQPEIIKDPKTGHRDAHAAQSISIFHSGTGAYPYPAASKYGVAYGMGPGSVFWKYFTVCSNDHKLCAQCTDGYKCPLDGIPGRQVLPADMSFAEFTRQKNAIVDVTGTPRCTKFPHAHAYNEFNSNGLSASDLAGVFSVNSGGAASRDHHPDDATVCAFLRNRIPNRRGAWPVYSYDAFGGAFGDEVNATGNPPAALRIERYICNGEDSTEAEEIHV